MLATLSARQSLMLIAEAGAGKSTLVGRVLDALTNYDRIAIAYYNGSVKQTLLSIAEQLGIAVNTDKPIQGEALKEEIIARTDNRTLIICDNAHRWAASLRYWLEILNDRGVVLILVAIEDLKKDIFVGMTKIELGKLSESEIRELMIRTAIAEDYSISPDNLAYLQSLAGSNPKLAKKLVIEAKIGRHSDGEHNQYINVAPFVNGALAALGIIRFVGLGLDNLSLYIFGGIAMLVGISLRYIGIGLNQSQRRKPLGKK